MVGLAPVALAGRGESGWSEKGEKAENRELDEGLSPSGALTAIILLESDGLSTDGRGGADHRCSSYVQAMAAHAFGRSAGVYPGEVDLQGKVRAAEGRRWPRWWCWVWPRRRSGWEH
jgi:hypothetical protein